MCNGDKIIYICTEPLCGKAQILSNNLKELLEIGLEVSCRYCGADLKPLNFEDIDDDIFPDT